MLTDQPSAGVLWCPDEAAFITAVDGYQTTRGPLPLLDGLAARRVNEEVAATWWRPDEAQAHPVGFVPGDRYEPVARLLAEVGGRELVAVDLSNLPEVSTGTLTVVSAPDALTGAVLGLAAARGRTSFFTARTLHGACALLLRTLVRADRDDDLFFDTTSDKPGSQRPSTATLSSDAVHVIGGRAHGRECLLHFDDSVLCGRSRDPGTTSEADGVLTSCQQGQGCFRRDLRGREQVRGEDLRCSVMFLDSCHVGGPVGRFGIEVSLALSVLDGDAVAVVGPPSVRASVSHAPALFAALLRAGLPLGEATDRLNRSTAGRTQGPVLVLGDAARSWPGRGSILRLRVNGSGSSRLVDAVSLLELEVGSSDDRLFASSCGRPLAVFRGCDEVAVAVRPDGGLIESEVDVELRPDDIRRWCLESLPLIVQGLVRLAFRGVDVDLARLSSWADQLRGIAEAWDSALSVPELAEAELRLAALIEDVRKIQSDIVARLVAQLAGSWQTPTDCWPRPTQFGPDVRGRCPACTREILHTAWVGVGLGPAAPLISAYCEECGDVTTGSPETPVELEIDYPRFVKQGESFEVGLSIRSLTERPLSAVLGTVVGAGAMTGARLADVTGLELAPGAFAFHRAVGTCADRGVADLVRLYVFLLVDGELAVHERHLQMRVRDQ